MHTHTHITHTTAVLCLTLRRLIFIFVFVTIIACLERIFGLVCIFYVFAGLHGSYLRFRRNVCLFISTRKHLVLLLCMAPFSRSFSIFPLSTIICAWFVTTG